MSDVQKPSPEIKASIKSWCMIQEKKYGPEWGTLLAKELAKKTLDDFTKSGLANSLDSNKKPNL